ncbi:malvidin galactosylase UGT88C3-like [Tasmannia lanceolata]|uniref:malvidin galactosylase UGT88C3-like n=1 Tax=Tasmannia lanceolata TaxID=3420 RepID=UPI0040638AAC
MKVRLVLLPSPGTGHMTPMVELAKRLVQHNSFSVTLLTMVHPLHSSSSSSSSTASYIESVAGLDITFIELPHVDLPFDRTKIGMSHMYLFIEKHKPHIKNAITQLQSSSPSTPIHALVLDFFMTSMFDVAEDLGIPGYIYFASGAPLLALMLYLPTLDAKITGHYKDLQEEVEIPGFPPLPPLVLPRPMLIRDDGYQGFISYAQRFPEAKGIIVNTFTELDSTVLEAINEGRCLPDHPTPPIYPVGPLIGVKENPETSSNACIEWLNKQPLASVVFLCFGSMGALPAAQVKEIALGLEQSGCRFLWALRFRSGEGFSMPSDANLDEILPEGFLDRTVERGLVWPSWAPQTEILVHPAVGGFVSHCGWNSFLESLWCGVPVLAWPLYAEQRLNAFLLVKELGLAVELRLDYKGEGLVKGEEVERGVRCLMGECEEGMKVRKRVKEFSEIGKGAVEEGGSSFATFKRLAHQFAQGT